MSEQCQIVKYRPEFQKELIELQAHLWRRDPATRAAYFDWKYVRNPYADDTFIYVAFQGDQLVGMVGAHGAQWQAGEHAKPFPGLCLGDLVIHPEHRQGNLASELTAHALHDLSSTSHVYALDFSAYRHTALILLFQGWRSFFVQTACRSLGDVPHPVTRFSSLAAPARRLRKLALDPIVRRLASPRPAFADLDANAGRQATTPNVTLGQVPRPREMAQLAERIGHDGRIRHVRDEQYFSWRFDNPLSEYRFLYWDDGQLEGYLVLYMKVADPGEEDLVYIVDWDATSAPVWQGLIDAALAWGDFDRISIWSDSLSESAKELLRDSGFDFRDKTGNTLSDLDGTQVLIAQLDAQRQPSDWTACGRDVMDPAQWDLRATFSDAF